MSQHYPPEKNAQKRVTLTLIRGLPGSGKSTLARTLKGRHLEADMFFITPGGQYHYRPEKIAQAHAWCQAETERSLAAGESVVVANTFVRQWEMAPYRRMAKKYRARLKIIVCRGDYDNIHGVDSATIELMRRRWQP